MRPAHPSVALKLCLNGYRFADGSRTWRSRLWKTGQSRCGGSGVLEIVDDFDGDTFRAVYTVRFARAIYVLHAFQKKSKRGVATPQAELDLIGQRLKRAKEDYEQWSRSATPKSR
jgi:Phage derived protein Gp49-like (DUF891)